MTYVETENVGKLLKKNQSIFHCGCIPWAYGMMNQLSFFMFNYIL